MSDRRVTVTILWDDEQRPEGVDADEWAYTLRMGGVDVHEVIVHGENAAPGYLLALLKRCDRGQYDRPACSLYQESRLRLVDEGTEQWATRSPNQETP